MTQKNVDIEVSGIDSKFMRIALTLVAVLLLFAGPTYVPYLMADVADSGIVLFQEGEAFVNLAWGLGIFLFVIIATEAVVYVWAKKQVDETATAILSQLA